MPIYVGNTEITDLKVGGVDVQEVYVGSQLVWSSAPPGPPVTDGLVGLYDFTSTDTITLDGVVTDAIIGAADQSGNGNDLQQLDTTRALQFTNNSAYIDKSVAKGFEFITPFAINPEITFVFGFIDDNEANLPQYSALFIQNGNNGLRIYHRGNSMTNEMTGTTAWRYTRDNGDHHDLAIPTDANYGEWTTGLNSFHAFAHRVTHTDTRLLFNLIGQTGGNPNQNNPRGFWRYAAVYNRILTDGEVDQMRQWMTDKNSALLTVYGRFKTDEGSLYWLRGSKTNVEVGFDLNSDIEPDVWVPSEDLLKPPNDISLEEYVQIMQKAQEVL